MCRKKRKIKTDNRRQKKTMEELIQKKFSQEDRWEAVEKNYKDSKI